MRKEGELSNGRHKTIIRTGITPLIETRKTKHGGLGTETQGEKMDKDNRHQTTCAQSRAGTTWCKWFLIASPLHSVESSAIHPRIVNPRIKCCHSSRHYI